MLEIDEKLDTLLALMQANHATQSASAFRSPSCLKAQKSLPCQSVEDLREKSDLMNEDATYRDHVVSFAIHIL
jgi:DNA-binding transcriptional regulator YiaG